MLLILDPVPEAVCRGVAALSYCSIFVLVLRSFLIPEFYSEVPAGRCAKRFWSRRTNGWTGNFCYEVALSLNSKELNRERVPVFRESYYELLLARRH